jgi:hypothetical protein
MNAGRDVEQLIANWLTEESPGRAPDRVLAGAATTIDHTKQRRLGVDWREPVTLSLRTLAAVAAVVVLALAGAAMVGRSTAVVGGPGPSSTSAIPGSSPTGAALAAFRAARNAICTPALARLKPLNDQLGVKDLPASEQAAVLDQIVNLGTETDDALATLQAPPELAAEQVADVTHHRDSILLIAQARDLLRANKIAEANALDDATGMLSHLEEEFAHKYALGDCP